MLSVCRGYGRGSKGLFFGEYKPELAPPGDREYLGLASSREGMQPSVFSIPSYELAVRLCSACPFQDSTDFFNFEHRAELQKLSEENFALKNDLGKIQLELETSESRNEVQR